MNFHFPLATLFAGAYHSFERHDEKKQEYNGPGWPKRRAFNVTACHILLQELSAIACIYYIAALNVPKGYNKVYIKSSLMKEHVTIKQDELKSVVELGREN